MNQGNNPNTNQDKEWKGIKFTPIREDEDGSNNYTEFKQKSILELDAANYWRFVDGPDYHPPAIPELKLSQQVNGLDNIGAPVTITVPRNEAVVAAARQQAEAWFSGDKKAHAIIVKAVPHAKTNMRRPIPSLLSPLFKQQILANQCGTHEDPVRWRQVMFAKHPVTLMTQADAWRYCRDSLCEKIRQGDQMGFPVTSNAVIQRLKQEEVEKGIAPSIVSINAMVTGGKAKQHGDAVPNAYAAATPSAAASNQRQRKFEKAQVRQGNRPAPYNSQQRSEPRERRKVCETQYCETPRGHVQADCFSYGGGKAGKYPEFYRGRRDVHLPLDARFAARRKEMLEGGGSGNRFAGLVEYTDDTEEDVETVMSKVEDGFAFMMSLTMKLGLTRKFG
ncbi:hypothetical protein C8R46DRAFT_1029305 [Mycena filopes]|nr:hypothetical protein C8R46DRAFT_1029305 [Mycena filopes]